jgi:hypothetical protein
VPPAMGLPNVAPALLTTLLLAALQLLTPPTAVAGWPLAQSARRRGSRNPLRHVTIFGDSNSDAGGAPFAVHSFY